MWSFFSRDPTKDFQYEINEHVPGLEDRSIWTLHHGKKKGSGDLVSIFLFDVKGNSESQIQIAKSSFRRIKTLRHPNILTFLDGIETDKVIYIATEPVIPLETYLNKNQAQCKENELAISWGLHQIAKGLSFLISDCNLIHNNVCISSIFVDKAGEWKLAGVDYMYPSSGPESVPPVKILPLLERYDPPEKTDVKKNIRGPKWSADMWGLGCLIWEVFNGSLPRTESLKSFGKIPKGLIPNYCELVGANPKSRPNPATFIQAARKEKGFLKNSFVDAMLFLEEIQIKDMSEKTVFFNSLTSSLDDFPQQFCKHKILPQLLNAFEYGNAGSAVLAPLFKIGKLLETDEYQKKIVPCVVKLFTSPDRATRVKLLQQIESFIEHLQPSTVNEQIFPNVIAGFMDTNPLVRESTIKAMMHMAPKLSYKNLNEELMKHFARLQSKDDQGGIRTNTTVCLGKIAGYLNPQMRQKILISAFLRALQDPFPPARQAGVLGMAVTQNFYTLQDIANRLLPAMCSKVMDSERCVRDEAFKAIRGFLAKLEKVSENPELAMDMEKDVMAGGVPNTSAAGWAGWAVTGMSSLTSKLYRKSSKPGAHTGPSQMRGVSPEAPRQHSPTTDKVPSSEESKDEDETEGWNEEEWGDIDIDISNPSLNRGNAEEEPSAVSQQDSNDWNDEADWGSLEDNSFTSQKENPINRSHGMRLEGGNRSAMADDWGWDQEESLSTENEGFQSTASYDWGTNTDDFFSAAMGKTKPQKSMTRPSKQTSGSRHEGLARVTGTSSGGGSREGSTHREMSPSSFDTATSTIKSHTKPSSTTSSTTAKWESQDFGWGDQSGGWNDNDWQSISDTPDTNRKKNIEREEKHGQHQKKIQENRKEKTGTRAMKLGAKKLPMT